MPGNLRGVNGISSGAKLVASLLHAVTEGLLGLLEIAAWVVAFLIADLAVDLKHALDVFAHVSDDGAGESILGVGVDVHLDDTVVEGFLEVVAGSSGAAVEDEVHFGFWAILVGDDLLSVTEDGWLELHGARFVGAVDVSEGGGEHKTTDWIEGLIDLHHIFGCGVKLLGGEAGGIVTVFFAADAAGFDFEDDVEFNAFLEEFDGDLHVLIQVDDGAIEHVGLEKRAFAFGNALSGGVEKGAEERIDLLRVAMISVEADEDVIFLGENMNSLGKNDGTEGRVIDRSAGCELAATGRDLDDAVGFRFREGLESAIGGSERGDVDGGIGVSTLLGGIEHLLVLFWCRDWHDWGGITLDQYDWQGWSCDRDVR